jgi:hypothetical protein
MWSEMDAASATDRAAPGLGPLRPPPQGMPQASAQPPNVAEAGDPFAALRVLDLLARVERGRPIRIADIVDRLNATHLDWLFDAAVVGHVVLQLQANWMADYRNASGIVVDDGPWGATIEIEDTTRVDPWIVRQAQREAMECRAQLAEFSLRDRLSAER